MKYEEKRQHKGMLHISLYWNLFCERSGLGTFWSVDTALYMFNNACLLTDLREAHFYLKTLSPILFLFALNLRLRINLV